MTTQVHSAQPTARSEASSTDAAIQVTGLTKIYGPRGGATSSSWPTWLGGKKPEDKKAKAAADDVTFSVAPGEFFVIMGLSGSGKSTVLRMLNRLIEPTSGELLIGGRNVETMPDDELRKLRNSKINMVFQHFALFPHRTVRENAAYALHVRNESEAKRNERADWALQTVGLGDWGDSLPGELSGGMRQRVGLARALASDADILLMDEPFSALDPLIRDKLQDDLLELQQRLHKTIIFVSHDLDEALKIGNTIAIMEGGRIIQAGRPEAIVTSPATDYVRNFVANVNPLNVLKLGTLMRPTGTLRRDGDRITLDSRIHLTATLNAGGAAAAVDGAGLPLRLVREIEPFMDGAIPCDWALLAPPEAPMRQAIEAMRASGWPVLVANEDNRVVGIVGIDELLEALRRRPN
jgi:glycine betaine/proline transport system ATP-binding protein